MLPSVSLKWLTIAEKGLLRYDIVMDICVADVAMDPADGMGHTINGLFLFIKKYTVYAINKHILSP
ncbi:hypothetical protein [Candidatus Cardinium hertigii]|uniref:Uncharacterized protein n=1 Tax=Candidatus Cardinium hertigii TaxID=247481 RepID=A0A2Z3L977_9BACT|nr:hypothetical protein [Candidatus Cardinium hertigii]AWN82103.1 hypothetical protein DK880_00797 [Candidatus Cardinium hertigii]